MLLRRLSEIPLTFPRLYFKKIAEELREPSFKWLAGVLGLGFVLSVVRTYIPPNWVSLTELINIVFGLYLLMFYTKWTFWHFSDHVNKLEGRYKLVEDADLQKKEKILRARKIFNNIHLFTYFLGTGFILMYTIMVFTDMAKFANSRFAPPPKTLGYHVELKQDVVLSNTTENRLNNFEIVLLTNEYLYGYLYSDNQKIPIILNKEQILTINKNI